MGTIDAKDPVLRGVFCCATLREVVEREKETKQKICGLGLAFGFFAGSKVIHHMKARKRKEDCLLGEKNWKASYVVVNFCPFCGDKIDVVKAD